MSKGKVPKDPGIRNKIIRMAWEDRTTFEEIEESAF